MKIILIKNYKKSVDKGFPPPHIDYAKGEQIMTVKQTTLELESLKQVLSHLLDAIQSAQESISSDIEQQDVLALLGDLENAFGRAQVACFGLIAQIKIKG